MRVKICTDRWAKFTEGFMIFLCHSKQMLRQYLQAEHVCFLPQSVYYSLCLNRIIDIHVKGENMSDTCNTDAGDNHSYKNLYEKC